MVLDGGGTVPRIYDKHHLVPFGEYIPFGSVLGNFGLRGLAAEDGDGFSAGPGPALLDLGKAGRALALICYEAIFPQDVNRAPTRPDFLLQTTNDAWFGTFSGPYQHLAQARMRAIEQGLPMVRAANTGVSAIIDARGKVTRHLALDTAGFIDAPLPAARRRRCTAGPATCLRWLCCFWGSFRWASQFERALKTLAIDPVVRSAYCI